MIILDDSETRTTSRMPSIPNAITSPILESLTGADVMVSPIDIPASTSTLITRHIKAGAVLLQFKFGSDFLSSIIDNRLLKSISRMVETAPRVYQRLVVSVGFFAPSKDGVVLLGEFKTSDRNTPLITWRRAKPEISYQSYSSARRRIGLRGAIHYTICDEDEIPAELLHLESDLKQMVKNPIYPILKSVQFPPDAPLPDDPLQRPVEVTDGRLVLAAFNGIGPHKATELWDAIRRWNRTQRAVSRGWTKDDWEPTLSQGLFWASVWNPSIYKLPEVSGWGEKTRAKVREQLGLYPGQDLRVHNVEIVMERETKAKEKTEVEKTEEEKESVQNE